MRWCVFVGVILLTVVVGVSLFVRARQGQAQPTSQQQTKIVAIPVEGMVCLACTGRVRTALKAIDGVTGVEVSLEHRAARVRYIDGKVSPDQLVAAVNHLGYRAGTPRPEEAK